jgi:hypothetical protein
VLREHRFPLDLPARSHAASTLMRGNAQVVVALGGCERGRRVVLGR